jgi:hypothetical protein
MNGTVNINKQLFHNAISNLPKGKVQQKLGDTETGWKEEIKYDILTEEDKKKLDRLPTLEKENEELKKEKDKLSEDLKDRPTKDALEEEKKLRRKIEKENEENLEKLDDEKQANAELKAELEKRPNITKKEWEEMKSKITEKGADEWEEKRLRLKLEEVTTKLDEKILFIGQLERKIERIEKGEIYLSRQVEGFFTCFACRQVLEVKEWLAVVMKNKKNTEWWFCWMCHKMGDGEASVIISNLKP